MAKKITLNAADKKIFKQVIAALNDRDEKTAIEILQNNKNVLKYFIGSYTNKLMKDDSGNFKASALMLAIEDQLYSLAKVLIDSGANINYKDMAHRTPLMIAAKRADNSLVALLISKGAKVNVVDVDGLSALIYAVGCEPDRKGVLAVTKTLLEAGADPNLEYANAIAYAEFEWAGKPLIDRDNIIKLLKQHGAVKVSFPTDNLDELVLEFEPKN